MGYTPYYTVGIWIGADNQILKMNGTSIERAAKMWNTVNNGILAGYEVKSFDRPSSIIEMLVDTMSGKKPTELSEADPRGTVITEIFGPKNKPKGEDDVHVLLTVDSRNNLLASDVTPSWARVERSFIQPKSDYNPKDFKNNYPRDWDYRAPSEYSDLIYVAPKPRYNWSNNNSDYSNSINDNEDNEDSKNQDIDGEDSLDLDSELFPTDTTEPSVDKDSKESDN